MSLKIKLLDKNNKVINYERPNILVDESVQTIKENLFCIHPDDISYYPNFITFKILNEKGEKQNLIDTSSILFNYNTIPDEIVMYMYNIIEEIEDDSVLASNIINSYMTNDTELNNIFMKLLEEYTDLSEDDFDFIVKLLFVKANAIVESSETRYIEEYITKILSKQKSVLKKCTKKMEQLQPFYDAEKLIDDYSKYFALSQNYVPIINFNNVSIVIQGNNVESGVKGKFIKLSNIFNTLQLSEDIPLMGLGDKTIGTLENPLIKVYNEIYQNENISDKDIKSWIINEKKKTNQIMYKKIKGLLIKYKVTKNNYMTVNILDNGIIEVKIQYKEDENNNSLDDIIKLLSEKLDILLDEINKLQGVFLQSKRLETSSNSKIMLESVSASIVTNKLINKNKFSGLLYNPYISEYVFELKDTISTDILSFYYKKYGKKEIDETEGERKGITVNIRDNPYQLNSSIINIYGAYNVHQLNVIAKQIVFMTKLYKEDKEQVEQKIKEKSHIKSLRKQGVNILSTKCQKPRQPIIDDKLTPQEASYTIDYQSKRYVCPKKDYPYPGFTNENIVCCFKKDQRGRDAFIRNIKSTDFEIMVSPSNFKIEITDSATKEKFTTYAIKVVSDYIDGLNAQNSVSRYHFISKDNELIAINDKQLIKKLEEEEENDIWLESVPLAKIITEPPKNKCNFTPNVDKKSNDINSPCEDHDKNKYFGYNLNSYPCCFDKERESYIQRKRKIADITKQHIMISDKTLDYQRIGTLPLSLDKLFNEIIKSDRKKVESKFYRMGVVQNNSALLGAILLAFQNNINNVYLNNTTEFRNLIVNYLQDNTNIFTTLNNGNISFKYNNLNKYKEYLLDNKTFLQYHDTIDLLERFVNVNILILEIPYILSESTQIADYENIKMICKNNIPEKSKNNPFIILLKRQSKYEVIIRLNTDKKSDKKEIEYLFDYETENNIKSSNVSIVNFLLDYYNSTCIKEDEYPENFKFNKMFTLDEITENFKNTEFEIVLQLVNVFNKVDMVMTKNNLLLPIKESGINTDIEVSTLKDIENKLIDVNEYYANLLNINKIIKNQDYMFNINGVTLSNDNKIDAIYTNYGIFIPVKTLNIEDSKQILTVLPIKYYSNINEYLVNGKHLDNKQVNYINKINELKKNIYLIKTQIAKQLTDVEKENIININKDTTIKRIDKINNIVSVFNNKQIQTPLDNKWLQFIFKHIANEVLNDNKENLLLNNLITSEVFDPNEITRRDTESILFNIDDIRKWFKKYE